MIGVFYGRNLTEMRSCHEKENRNAIVEIKRELNQFTIYYSVIVTLNDKKLAQITKLFLPSVCIIKVNFIVLVNLILVLLTAFIWNTLTNVKLPT